MIVFLEEPLGSFKNYKYLIKFLNSNSKGSLVVLIFVHMDIIIELDLISKQIVVILFSKALIFVFIDQVI